MLSPFDLLFEADLPDYPLPEDLRRVYGRLGFADRVVYSNFVSSLDGVVSLGEGLSAGSVISGKNAADRFLMALLRACADAVVIGAGTLRATPGHLWTPAHVYRDLTGAFAELRRTLGRSPEPRLMVLTADGELDFKHPALVNGATILTTNAGTKRIGNKLPPACDVIALDEIGNSTSPPRPLRGRTSPHGGEAKGKQVDIKRAFDEMGKRGFNVVLTEGGPHLMGELVENNLVGEMFLTISPVIAGRDKERRLGMVEGVELLPSVRVTSRLLSARRSDDYLFLRYGLTRE